MTQAETLTVEDLRERAVEVAMSFEPLIAGIPSRDELQARADRSRPVPCGGEESYQIRLGFIGEGTTETDAFVDRALELIEAAGLSTEDYSRGSSNSSHTYVSGRADDGQVIAIEVEEHQVKFQYETACSTDASLREALDEARDSALNSSGDESVKPKPSKWGIRA